MAQGTWVLQKCANERFPYRLQILRGDKPWIVLRTQDKWPAAGRHIFCLREEDPPLPDEVLEELERVDIVAFNERGRRISVVLDRKRYKRCDFLFLKKSYKGRPGESYEQIFWLTQRSIEQHRPAFKLVSRQGSSGLLVRINSNERYPWRFPGAVTERGAIPAGDYALMDGDRMLTVVERKTLDKLLADFGMMPVLHHYTASFCARAIAELYTLHPHLHIVFCGNRKAANEWTRHLFAAIWALRKGSDSK